MGHARGRLGELKNLLDALAEPAYDPSRPRQQGGGGASGMVIFGGEPDPGYGVRCEAGPGRERREAASGQVTGRRLPEPSGSLARALLALGLRLVERPEATHTSRRVRGKPQVSSLPCRGDPRHQFGRRSARRAWLVEGASVALNRHHRLRARTPRAAPRRRRDRSGARCFASAGTATAAWRLEFRCPPHQRPQPRCSRSPRAPPSE
jgi:hypothetical protein